MDAIMKMMAEVTRLQTAAKVPGVSADKLREIMLESAANLNDAAERAAPLWGRLVGTVKELEKYKK